MALRLLRPGGCVARPDEARYVISRSVHNFSKLITLVWLDCDPVRRNFPRTILLYAHKPMTGARRCLCHTSRLESTIRHQPHWPVYGPRKCKVTATPSVGRPCNSTPTFLPIALRVLYRMPYDFSTHFLLSSMH